MTRVSHVIIEGPDAAGKTTLAQALCAAGYDYRHEGPPPASSALSHYAGVLARVSRSTLFDRLHLGELVYGPIVRGQSGLSEYGFRVLRRIVKGYGIRVILCLPPFDRAFTNWHARHRQGAEFLRDADMYARSYAAFQQLRGEVDHVYSYVDGPPPIEEYLAPLPVCPSGVIGDPAAAFLFVGEHSADPLDLPFVDERGASVFLTARLDEAGFVEADLSFTDAFWRNGQPVDLAQRVRPGQRVVTLGAKAAAAARAAGITPDATLPHPQFWQRFHARDSDTYVRWLTDIRRRNAL